MNNRFITQAELSREARVPVNRITSAVEAGLLVPFGRAGNHPHAPLIFDGADLPRLIETLQTGVRFRGVANIDREPHRCGSAKEVLQKYSALKTAGMEAAK